MVNFIFYVFLLSEADKITVSSPAPSAMWIPAVITAAAFSILSAILVILLVRGKRANERILASLAVLKKDNNFLVAERERLIEEKETLDRKKKSAEKKCETLEHELSQLEASVEKMSLEKKNLEGDSAEAVKWILVVIREILTDVSASGENGGLLLTRLKKSVLTGREKETSLAHSLKPLTQLYCPGIVNKLYGRYPSLSEADMEIICMLILKLPAAAIQFYCGQTNVASYYNRRNRLRKKLGTPRDEHLEAFLITLVEEMEKENKNTGNEEKE